MEELEERPFFYFLRDDLRGVIVGDWKYIIPHSGWWGIKTVGKNGKNGTMMTVNIPESLYNVTKDIKEKNNLINTNNNKAIVLKRIATDFESRINLEKRSPGLHKEEIIK